MSNYCQKKQITIFSEAKPNDKDLCCVTICDLHGGTNKVVLYCHIDSVSDIVKSNL